jgi:hypothetical protein
MKISTEQAIFIAVIGVLLAVSLGVTYFYLMPKLEVYQEDERVAAQLEATFQEFRETFHGIQPDTIITEIERRTQPWMDSREDWGQPFNLGDWTLRFSDRPEEMFARFWYDEESRRLLEDFVNTMRTKNPRLLPADSQNPAEFFRDKFGVASIDDWKSVPEVSEQMARRELNKLSLCISMYEYLLEHNPTSVGQVVHWPHRLEDTTGSWLVFRTFGLQFTMRFDDLIDLLEELRLEERYFHVDAIQMNWDYPWYQPELNVRMLLTQANWIPPERRGGGERTAAAPGAPAAPGPRTPANLEDFQRRLAERSAQREQQIEEPGFFSKLWTWFKRNVLYISG